MELEQAESMVEFLQNEGYEAELYKGYSGRGMFGKTTTGVTTDARPATMEALEDDMEEYDIESGYASDNMGLDYIYY